MGPQELSAEETSRVWSCEAFGLEPDVEHDGFMNLGLAMERLNRTMSGYRAAMED